MPVIDYEKLASRRVDTVPPGSKVKLPGDPAGRMFTVGGVDQYGMISLLRGKADRIEVRLTPSHPVVIHEIKEE